MNATFPSLPTEIPYLLLAGVLLLVHLGVQAIAMTREFGSAYNAGPRDEQRKATGIAGRAERAFRNYLETFPLFAAMVIGVHVSGTADWWSGFGAALYFWARVAYLPLYLAGIPYLRSAIWSLATLGILIIMWRLAI